VVPYSYTQEAHESLAELLASHVSAGTFFAKEFSMILWPARSSAWGFLEKGLPAVSPGAILRFAVRAPLPHLVNQIEPPITRYLRQENARKYAEIKNTIDNMPIQPEEKHITLIFREMFGIDFNRLIAPNGTQKQPPGKNFFLCFVPANCEQYEPDGAKRQALRWRTSEEHDFFVQFLRANGAETICSMQDIGSYEAVQNGSWRYFIEEVKGGAIIVSPSPAKKPIIAKSSLDPRELRPS